MMTALVGAAAVGERSEVGSFDKPLAESAAPDVWLLSD
jgi:hypothetical protein